MSSYTTNEPLTSGNRTDIRGVTTYHAGQSSGVQLIDSDTYSIGPCAFNDANFEQAWKRNSSFYNTNQSYESDWTLEPTSVPSIALRPPSPRKANTVTARSYEGTYAAQVPPNDTNTQVPGDLSTTTASGNPMKLRRHSMIVHPGSSEPAWRYSTYRCCLA
ncbi:hypothetical protein EJ05DRAFT_245093 [Pseudovirgaria hyperparasitica]|uniref:Uncharacterized protein n=1 Tax=Pseudovirgaria hyperparasitica TaxID=470096 RepID=A0A6A6WDH2_9PEZI|nr:uncharacterized protein EJ05DRAFT_245093 [Pseudovirgaria hyperparasitica]KAF2760878.1 hypothetical protein EJ05DRAFT_245093 [Pseudovirgaria hyperparasitica]